MTRPSPIASTVHRSLRAVLGKRPSRRLRGRATPRVPAGSPPGTLQVPPDAHAPRIHVMAYGPEGLQERRDVPVESLVELQQESDVLWVDVVGLGDADTIRAVGERFGLHPLSLEDVLNVVQRPKLEAYGNDLYIVTRIASGGDAIDSEQISLFLGTGLVVTFQERPGDCFEPVRERIRAGTGRLRGAGADYLAYALLDSVVDHYFPIVEDYGERLEQIEERVLVDARRRDLTDLFDVRHELVALRRVIHGLRDVLARMLKETLPIVTSETRVYVRDGHDHALRLLEDVEGWRELTSSLMEVHRSVVGQQLNAVMKVLTIIATIFIPLSFIAGVYGMNFDPNRSSLNMPELRWSFGYPFALGLMATVAAAQLLYFHRRGWLRAD